MMFPSLIVLPETLKIVDIGGGGYSVVNAYKGEYYEYFPGRPLPINSPDDRTALSSENTPHKE